MSVLADPASRGGDGRRPCAWPLRLGRAPPRPGGAGPCTGLCAPAHRDPVSRRDEERPRRGQAGLARAWVPLPCPSRSPRSRLSPGLRGPVCGRRTRARRTAPYRTAVASGRLLSHATQSLASSGLRRTHSSFLDWGRSLVEREPHH